MKESWFWIFDLKDSPTSIVLRGQLVETVLNEVVNDINKFQ